MGDSLWTRLRFLGDGVSGAATGSRRIIEAVSGLGEVRSVLALGVDIAEEGDQSLGVGRCPVVRAGHSDPGPSICLFGV